MKKASWLIYFIGCVLCFLSAQWYTARDEWWKLALGILGMSVSLSIIRESGREQEREKDHEKATTQNRVIKGGGERASCGENHTLDQTEAF